MGQCTRVVLLGTSLAPMFPCALSVISIIERREHVILTRLTFYSTPLTLNSVTGPSKR